MRLASLSFSLAIGLAAASAPLAAETDLERASAEAALWSCAEIWATESHERLDVAVGRAGLALTHAQSLYEKRLQTYPDEIKRGEEDVVRLNAAWEASLSKAIEDAAQTGLEISLNNVDEIAKALGSDLANEKTAQDLRAAEARLAGLKQAQARDKATVLSLRAQSAMIKICADDQRAYLGPVKPTTPTKPTTGQDVVYPPGPVLKITGTLNAVCVNANDPTGRTEDYPGTFALDVATLARATSEPTAVSGALDFGTGSLPLSGKLFGTVEKPNEGRIVVEDTSMGMWKLEGQMAEAQSELIVAGTVTAQNPNTGSTCSGKFNGKQAR
jgi:hypothetical protein